MTTGQRPSRPGRRAVLLAGGGLAAGAAASAGWALSESPAAPPGPAVIAPDDDLMREHGVLKRVLCYREMTARSRRASRWTCRTFMTRP